MGPWYTRNSWPCLAGERGLKGTFPAHGLDAAGNGAAQHRTSIVSRAHSTHSGRVCRRTQLPCRCRQEALIDKAQWEMLELSLPERLHPAVQRPAGAGTLLTELPGLFWLSQHRPATGGPSLAAMPHKSVSPCCAARPPNPLCLHLLPEGWSQR